MILPVREFRPSQRNTIVTATFLAVATWLLLRVALRFDPRPATIATICALASLLALRLAFGRPHHALRPADDGLSIRDGATQREVPWTAIRRVGLAYGEIETPRGTARVQYARIEVSSGPPIAFADLSALDGAEVVLEDTPIPVIDIADPELLLGIIAERTDNRDFLPRGPAAPGEARSWLGGLGTVVITLRGIFFAVLAVAAAEILWTAPSATIVGAIGGLAAALSVSAGAQFVGSRIALPGRTYTPSVAALFPTFLAALAAWRLFAATEHAPTAGWILAGALTLALPVGPLPGAAIARSIGAWAARPRTDAPAALLIAATGALSALLLARGLRVVPVALLAGTAEAAEAYVAGLRANRLTAAPRFSQWPVDMVAQLRDMLRASFDDDLADRTTALDRSQLARTEYLRRNRPAPVGLVLAAIASIACTTAVAVHGVRGNDSARDALAVLSR